MRVAAEISNITGYEFKTAPNKVCGRDKQIMSTVDDTLSKVRSASGA